MKQFSNLYEAFHHQPRCPLCQDSLDPDYKEVSTNADKTAVTFIVGSDDVTIDYYDNQIVSHKSDRTLWNYSNRGTPGNYYIGKAGLQGSGTEMFKVTASCNKCSKYGYVLQLHVRLDEGRLIGIFLNSESVSIEEGDTLHEIKNIYATEKTEYDKFTRFELHNETVDASGWSGRRNGTISFPLMPLDVKNPEMLLNRIKNLIVFS